MIINFITGVMGAGKTEQLIEDYNYYPNGMIVKVSIKAESKFGTVESRNGKAEYCLVIDANQTADEILALLSIYIEKYGLTEYLLIDEAQFLDAEQINAIESAALIAKVKGIIFYGLMSDFKAQTFEGSEWLMKIVDNVFVIPAECSVINCEADAVYNARIINGKIRKEGKLLEERKDLYQPLCPHHYHTL